MADFSSSGNKLFDALSLLIFLGLVCMFAVVIHTFNSSGFDQQNRIEIFIGTLLWAVAYTFVRRVWWLKIGFGALQVAASGWVNWYQLGKLANEGWHGRGIDHILFMCGGVAVMSKGIKDIEEAVQAWLAKRKSQKPTDATVGRWDPRWPPTFLRRHRNRVKQRKFKWE